MARKTYISARGTNINFDQLFLRNDKVIAVGNTRMNARGDRIGPGGKIIETVEQIRMKAAARQKDSANDSYNTTNPNAVKMVSIKQNVDDMATSYHNSPDVKVFEEGEAKTPAQVVKDLEAKALQQDPPVEEKKTQNKRKIVDKED